jgi:ribosomal protein L29
MFISKKRYDQIVKLLNEVKEIQDKEIETYTKEINDLKIDLFQLKYPNGYCHSERKDMSYGYYYYNYCFDYIHNNKIISSILPCNDMDYTKTDKGYLFVTKERDKAYLLKFGSEECISIPYPCVCE